MTRRVAFTSTMIAVCALAGSVHVAAGYGFGNPPALPPQSAQPAQQPPAPSPIDPSTYVVEKNVMVAMRDGVKLATDIYFPAAGGAKREGKFPAIMERTPYNKDGASRGNGPFYASNGYVYIAQDTRGRYGSEGVWRMMVDDVPDGHDAAKWLVAQPWSDGGFGMVGGSYVGGTQHAMALSNAPGLKAIVPIDAVSNTGYFGMRNGGAFELRFMNWIFTIGAPNGSRAARDAGTKAVLDEAGKNVRRYLESLPLRKGMTPIRLAPEYEEWLVMAMSRGENDKYWKQPGLNVSDNVRAYKDIPVYVVGGWHDSWARQSPDTFASLAKAKKSANKLIMGPWIHGRQGRAWHGQVEFGAAAAINMRQFHLRWFDHWLKGAANGVENEAPVKIFVMGTGPETKGEEGRHIHGGEWRDEKEWPLARTKWTPYYLHADGSLTTEKPAATDSSTAYDFDPRNPVPTIGGNISSGDGIMLQGAFDQKCGEHVWNCKDTLPLSARRDVLVFQTEPLKENVEVTGPIDVKLWISSSALDTDFTAKLIDVHPPTADFPGGIDMHLGDGITRARFRASLEKAELMKPGTVYELTVRLYPTSNIFKKGHRIRLDISSSNFPRFDVNPNTGEPLNAHRRMVTATNTIYHDRLRASHVVLPVIPTR